MKLLTILLIAVCAQSLSAQSLTCNLGGIQIKNNGQGSVYGCTLGIQNSIGRDNYVSADVGVDQSKINNVWAIAIEAGSTSTVFPSILSRTFPNVWAVQFTNGGLTTIGESAFRGFSKLSNLYLNNNAISDINANAFTGNPSLTYIDLSNNQLAVIPSGLFSGQKDLRDLKLNNNPFASLPSGLFTNLQSLKGLEIQDCGNLRSFGSNFFNGPNEIGTIIINGNPQLTQLPADFFNGVTTISDLSLSNNGLTSLPDGLFNGKTVTFWVDLSRNKFVAIRSGPFNGLTTLRISFKDNLVQTIERGFVDSCVAQNRILLLSGPCYDGEVASNGEFDKTLIAHCTV